MNEDNTLFNPQEEQSSFDRFVEGKKTDLPRDLVIWE